MRKNAVNGGSSLQPMAGTILSPSIQDVNLYAALLDSGEEISHVIPQNRHAWLQVARGQVVVNGEKMTHGDGLAVSPEERLTVSVDIPAELLLFDLS